MGNKDRVALETWLESMLDEYDDMVDFKFADRGADACFLAGRMMHTPEGKKLARRLAKEAEALEHAETS